MNELNNLKKWCEQYGSKNNVKLHPNTAPLDLVCDSMLERLDNLQNRFEELFSQVKIDNNLVEANHAINNKNKKEAKKS